MPALSFRLNLDPEALKAIYRGQAPVVLARTEDGRRLRFPAEHLRPFITRDGVQGCFRLEFDQHNKIVNLQQLS